MRDSFFIILIAGLILLYIIRMIIVFNRFCHERMRLNFEIERTTGKDRRHYKKLRRKLWLNFLFMFRYYY